MKNLTIKTTALAALLASSGWAAASPIQSIAHLWTFNHGVAPTSGRSSEIPFWDAGTNALWIVGGDGLDVLDLGGNRLASFATTAFGAVNSIAIAGSTLALSFSNGIQTSAPGSVQFFDTATFLSQGATAAYLGGVNTGAVPDMITWTAGGSRLLVANEGERQSNSDNPVGSVSIIDVNRSGGFTTTVQTAGFTAFDGQEAVLRTAGVRIQAGVSASVAFEPEYIAVSPDGTRAMVTLQENNALAELNLQTLQFTRILPLGTKDYSLADNGFGSSNAIDPSDQDGAVSFRNVPVKGLYMPDAIVSYSVSGQAYYVMPNEGDAFVDDADIIRLGNAAVTLDPTVFPNAAELKANSNLGRLNIVRDGVDGTGSITNMTEIVTLGGRSFSIRDADGNLVWDSGNTLELEAAARGVYADGRSDDKGVEPEGVAVYTIAGRTLAFIGLERTTRSAVAIYDITDPANSSFLDMLVSDDANVLRPEGLSVFEAGGQIYLAVANESPSNRTTLYAITPVPEPGTWALMALGVAALGAVARRRRG